MPTTFQDREQAFEAKFAHDEELRFLVGARRDKLFARWAAERLQMTDEATAALVRQILSISGGKGHDDAVTQFIGNFLSEHSSPIQAAELLAALARCMTQAQRQLSEDPPKHSEIL